MFHKKPKLIYKKNPYVGKRQIRRRVMAIVNDMLVTLSENNQNTEKIDNVSTDNNIMEKYIRKIILLISLYIVTTVCLMKLILILNIYVIVLIYLIIIVIHFMVLIIFN